jgi:hypothetical protein
MKEISADEQSVCETGLSSLPEIETIGCPCCYRAESLLLVMHALRNTSRQV